MWRKNVKHDRKRNNLFSLLGWIETGALQITIGIVDLVVEGYVIIMEHVHCPNVTLATNLKVKDSCSVWHVLEIKHWSGQIYICWCSWNGKIIFSSTYGLSGNPQYLFVLLRYFRFFPTESFWALHYFVWNTVFVTVISLSCTEWQHHIFIAVTHTSFCYG